MTHRLQHPAAVKAGLKSAEIVTWIRSTIVGRHWPHPDDQAVIEIVRTEWPAEWQAAHAAGPIRDDP